MKSDRQGLVEKFDQMKHPVSDARLAWTGLYPALGGWTNWGWMLTRHRCVALVAESVEVWTIWPPFPKAMVASAPIAEVSYLRKGRKYDRLRVGSYRVWTSATDRADLLAWIDAPTA